MRRALPVGLRRHRGPRRARAAVPARQVRLPGRPRAAALGVGAPGRRRPARPVRGQRGVDDLDRGDRHLVQPVRHRQL